MTDTGVLALTMQPATGYAYLELPSTLRLVKAAVLYADAVEVCSSDLDLDPVDPYFPAPLLHDEFFVALDEAAAMAPSDDPRAALFSSGAMENPAVEALLYEWKERTGFTEEIFERLVRGIDLPPGVQPRDILARLRRFEDVPPEILDRLPVLGSPGASPYLPGDGERAAAALGELVLAARAGVVRFPAQTFTTTYTQLIAAALDPRIIPVVDGQHVALFARSGLAQRRAAEGTLAHSLFGALEAFPDAPMDVVLDVRERLSQARSRLQAAVAQAGVELADGLEDARTFESLTFDLRRRVLVPALEDIEDELEALRARPTLMRLASDSASLTAAAALLTLGALAPGSVLDLGALAPAVAAATKELLHREQVARSASSKPYWALYAAQQELTRRRSSAPRRRGGPGNS